MFVRARSTKHELPVASAELHRLVTVHDHLRTKLLSFGVAPSPYRTCPLHALWDCSLE
jgi:hypothetical protein